MEDVADAAIRKARENLTKWEDTENPLAPIEEDDKDSIIGLLSISNFRDISHGKESNATQLSENKDATNVEDKGEASSLSISTFLTWLDTVAEDEPKTASDSMRSTSDRRTMVDYVGQLNSHQKECQALLEQLDAALEHLKQLQCQYTSVSTRTTALHTDCEHLLAEQNRLSNTGDTVQSKLWYFTQVDFISQKLTSPAFSVTSDGFVPLLARIDQCIAYMKNNPKCRESSVYHVRYMHCLSRALSLIRNYVTKSLENATKQVCPRPEKSIGNSENATILYYSKFRTNAPRIKSLMKEIEVRIGKLVVDTQVHSSSLLTAQNLHHHLSNQAGQLSTNTTDDGIYNCHSLHNLYNHNQGDYSHIVEYQNLLGDCHLCYFQQRQLLMAPCVNDAVSQLVYSYRKDYCSLIRSGCAFLVHVCEDEHTLYNQFFTMPTPELDNFLEGLCTVLYDGLRPLIIHIEHLETLSELCSILNRGMIEEHLQSNPRELAALRVVVTRMLEDAQERLVYRTHVYIASDIAGFVPSPGDLAYPSKLQLMEQIAKEIASTARHTHSRTFSDACSVISLSSEGGYSGVGERFSRVGSSPADLHGMWYPTLRRTLMCLSKLYRCVDRAIFQGVSLDAVSACVQSLKSAASTISTTSSATHAYLFQIKHLLILREQLAPFQVDSCLKEMSLDWSKVKDAAYGLVQHRANLFSLSSNNALLQFIVDGTPHVVEQLMDSKRDVDTELKRVCEKLIQTSTESLICPLTAFLAKIDVICSINKREENVKPIQLKNQPFAIPEKIGEIANTVRRNIRCKLPELQSNLHLYLANRDTEFILLKPVRLSVASAFARLNKLLSEHYTVEDVLIASCPSVDEVNAVMNTLLEVRDEPNVSEPVTAEQERSAVCTAANETLCQISRPEQSASSDDREELQSQSTNDFVDKSNSVVLSSYSACDQTTVNGNELQPSDNLSVSVHTDDSRSVH